MGKKIKCDFCQDGDCCGQIEELRQDNIALKRKLRMEYGGMLDEQEALKKRVAELQKAGDVQSTYSDEYVAKLERIADAARDWCQDTFEECNHQPSWKSLKRALDALDEPWKKRRL